MVAHFEKKMIDGMTAKGYKKEYSMHVLDNTKALAVMVSWKIMRQVSHYWYMFLPGSNIIRTCLPLHYSTVCRWDFISRQIIIDARKRHVEVRPVDINHSDWDNTLEEKSGKFCALRLAFRQVKGLREDDMNILVAKRNP